MAKRPRSYLEFPGTGVRIPVPDDPAEEDETVAAAFDTLAAAGTLRGREEPTVPAEQVYRDLGIAPPGQRRRGRRSDTRSDAAVDEHPGGSRRAATKLKGMPAPVSQDERVAPRRRDQPLLEALREVSTLGQHQSVEVDPKRQHGKPVVAGTSVPVSLILTRLAAGCALEQIAGEFPDITVEQVRGAVAYAAEVLDHEVGK